MEVTYYAAYRSFMRANFREYCIPIKSQLKLFGIYLLRITYVTSYFRLWVDCIKSV